jgi:hypothetical protein
MASMDPDTCAALERLIRIANGRSGQSEHIASLLLAWWCATENGGFAFRSLWKIDEALVADALRLIIWIARHPDVWPTDTEYSEQIRAIQKIWGPILKPVPAN